MLATLPPSLSSPAAPWQCTGWILNHEAGSCACTCRVCSYVCLTACVASPDKGHLNLKVRGLPGPAAAQELKVTEIASYRTRTDRVIG